MTNTPERIWASAGETWNGFEEGSSWDDGLYTRKRENAYDVEYIRADLVPQWQPIETMPRDGTIVIVWAKWDWSGMYGDGCDEPYSAQPAYYVENEWGKSDGIWSETFNPYENKAVGATHWMPTPTPPNEPKREP